MRSIGSGLKRPQRAADNAVMARRIAVGEILDKHHISCPRCSCSEAVVLLNEQFEVLWQCVDCECRWPASEEESSLLLKFATKMIH
jgi:hypothetical protein